MNKNGLLVEPEFDKPEKYLKPGKMTAESDKINELLQSKKIKYFFYTLLNRGAKGRVIRELLVLMNTVTKRLNSPGDNRKFKRTAEEILESGERTGCCDSSTVAITLARALEIPAMQIITFDIEKAKESKAKGLPINAGHFFTAFYLSDISGNFSWYIVDTDRKAERIEDVELIKMDTSNRIINGKFYAFAYAGDYRDVEVKTDSEVVTIDSIQNMLKIHEIAYDGVTSPLYKNVYPEL